MALFEQSHYGKMISDELRNILADLIEPEEVRLVASKRDIGASTLRAVITQRHKLTPNTGHAIAELMQRAYENANAVQQKTKDNKTVLKRLLGAIQKNTPEPTRTGV